MDPISTTSIVTAAVTFPNTPAGKKLMDVLHQAGVGVFKPYQISRVKQAEYEAEAQGKITLAKAELEIQELRERAASRLISQELRAQKNIENISQIAAKEIEDQSDVNDDPVDPDWIHTFFDNCKHIGNDEMQLLWGKLLAGEIRKPNTYSASTLDILSKLNSRQAKAFREFSRCVFCLGDNRHIHLHTSQTSEFLSQNGLDFGTFLEFKELGLLHVGSDLAHMFTVNALDEESEFNSQEGIATPLFLHKKIVTIHATRIKGRNNSIKLKSYPLTNAGNQLFHLSELEPNMEYLECLVASQASVKSWQNVEDLQNYVATIAS